MTLGSVLSRITSFIQMIIEGTISSAYTDQESIISQWCHFVIDHPIILFFVLCSLIYIGISILRRLQRV